MSIKSSSSNIFGSVSAENRSFNMRTIFNKIFFHWPLYFIFFVLCFGIARFYLKYTQPVFEIHAKVLIKDYQHFGEQKAALEQLNLQEPQTEKDLQAEIGLMNSVPVTEQVVTDLQLWATYKQKTNYFSYKDIYNTTPVQFKLLKSGRNFASDHLDITIESPYYFRIKHSDDTTSERFAFKDTFIKSFGTWKLDTTTHIREYIGKTIRITLNNPKDIVKYYQDVIVESQILKSADVDIVMNDEVPERGKAILSDLLRVYMDASIQEKRQSTQNTLKFVSQRLSSITQELNSVESAYQGFKSSRGITDIADRSSTAMSNEQGNSKQINEINIKLSVLDGIERYLNSNAGADSPPATLGLDDQGLNGLINKLTELQLERTKLLATLPENNPLFNPINQQISSTKTAIRENIKGIRSSLVTTKSQLQLMGSSYVSSIRSVPEDERGLNDIKRMQAIKENLYIYLLQKKEELSLDYASTISDAIIIDEPHTGLLISPVSKAAYAIAFLLGFLIPTGILFGRDAIKNRILSKSEIVSGTGLPILSEIVYQDTDDRIVMLNQSSYIGEQFRDLRTKLNYLHGRGEKGRVTLLTSSIGGEGKSFVLSNLGLVLSVSGKKTILLELDLRKPTFSTIFKLDKTKLGLSDYLFGDATKAQIIQPLAVSENLFVIDCGTIPPNPSELLESIELADLIKELRTEYDHILIDSPPVHLLTDATIIAPLCDVTLYVIRQDYTPKQELEFITEVYNDKKLPRMNLVFNGIKSELTGGGYGYSYQKNTYYTQSPKKVKSRIKRFFSRF